MNFERKLVHMRECKLGWMCLTCTKTISSELLIKKKSATCFTKKRKANVHCNWSRTWKWRIQLMRKVLFLGGDSLWTKFSFLSLFKFSIQIDGTMKPKRFVCWLVFLNKQTNFEMQLFHKHIKIKHIHKIKSIAVLLFYRQNKV